MNVMTVNTEYYCRTSLYCKISWRMLTSWTQNSLLWYRLLYIALPPSTLLPAPLNLYPPLPSSLHLSTSTLLYPPLNWPCSGSRTQCCTFCTGEEDRPHSRWRWQRNHSLGWDTTCNQARYSALSGPWILKWEIGWELRRLSYEAGMVEIRLVVVSVNFRNLGNKLI